MDSCCYGDSCGSEMRRFLTRDEKVQMLKAYKDRLDNESKGVSERISELQDEEA